MADICKEELRNRTFIMPGFRKFRTGNDIFQKDIAEYLGVTTGFVSAVERCQTKLPGDKLIMLLENPFGWVTDALFATEPQKIYNNSNLLTGDHAVSSNEIGEINNYGYSEEDLKQRVELATALIKKDLEIAQVKNDQLEKQVLFLQEEIRGLRELLSKERKR